MRRLVVIVAVCLVPALAVPTYAAQDGATTKRYGIEVRPKKYPQQTAKEALASVLAAIEENQIGYLLAQLADPNYVDMRVKTVYGGNFDDFVKDASNKLADNPAEIKELQQFLKSGEWDETAETASVKLKNQSDRQVFFRKVGDRWFMENKQKQEK
jgi:hypothetical protein